MQREVVRSGDDDRDYEAWLGRVAAQLARDIIETDLESTQEEEDDPESDA